MPREMLTPAEDHMTVTEALALEGLCGGSAIALRDASVPGGWVCGGRLWGSCGDSGHVLVVLGAVVVVVDLDEGYCGGGRGILPPGDGAEGSCWVDGFDSLKSWIYDPFEDEVFEFLTR